MLYDLDDETGNKYDDYWVLEEDIPICIVLIMYDNI